VRERRRSSLLSRGEPLVWLTGSAMVICILMIAGLIALLVLQGGATFWPRPIHALATTSGRYLGEISDEERYTVPRHVADGLPEPKRRALDAAGGQSGRRLFRTGNYRITGTHFVWLSDFEIESDETPGWAVCLERLEWGNAYGTPKEFLVDGTVVASGAEEAWERFLAIHDDIRARRREQAGLERGRLGEANDRRKAALTRLKNAERSHGGGSDAYRKEAERCGRVEAECDAEIGKVQAEIGALRNENARYGLRILTASGQESDIPVAEIVRGVAPNRLGFMGKVGVYLSRWKEFLADDPREANTEGGVFPALFGTVVMTLLMSLLVVPFGVLAALYLREYARQGLLVSIVRIAVNNLAGVPSIVFGVFGLGFFCYIVGKSLDATFFSADLPNPTFGKGGLLWASLTLALLTLPVVVVATEEALAAVPASMREGSYACGAGKWQTIRRIVLPRAMPGIMTGMILAIARGAGEVAPLMLVGAVKLAPHLPVDTEFPFVHPERSFMHLGFHIYDLGFQSPNSQAAKPMVFTTTLLLISIIVALNLAAVLIRSRLRRQFEVA